ncbi:unannotated protein [freshwater metagenome]|uniref:Unannotated protein n=1 Tax=freshwater metagenome TaxID=449393 RepID=A0A6J7BDZ9_9ZZZZ
MDRINTPKPTGRSTISTMGSNVTLSKGYLVIHSAPAALTKHVEWAIQNLLGKAIVINWEPQPLVAGTHKTTVEWRDRLGAGAELASALRGWHYLRFEIREESVTENVLYRFTPELGIHRALIDGAGSVLVTEHQLLGAMDHDEDSLRQALANAMGTAWDLELEQFRRGDLNGMSQSQAI